MSKYSLPSTIIEVENHVGHWAIGTGAAKLVDEVRESRKIAKRVHEILKASGVPSTYFQDDTSKNKDQNLKTLVAHHNQDTNGLVTSYHLNSSSSSIVEDSIGVEVLYVNDDLKKLAEDLATAISKASGLKNRGAKKRTNLYVLNGTKEPAILIETFFVNSRKDVELYNKHFEAICNAIATVLSSAVHKPIVSDNKPIIRELNINSQSLNDVTNAILASKAQREIIVDYAIAEGAHPSWREKLDKRIITDDEILALAAKTIVDINK